MKKLLPLVSVFLFTVAIIIAVPGSAMAEAKISAAEYKAGDKVTIEGTIAPGKDLYIAVAQSKMFAPTDTKGVHEVKRLKKDGKKNKFNNDTKIPPLYYMLTNNPEAFGKEGKKRFGGRRYMSGG